MLALQYYQVIDAITKLTNAGTRPQLLDVGFGACFLTPPGSARLFVRRPPFYAARRRFSGLNASSDDFPAFRPSKRTW